MDEEILHRRILYDGDSSHDKRITLLRKNFLKLCNSEDISEEDKVLFQKYLVLLSQTDYANDKNNLVYKTTEKQIKLYHQQEKDIEENIELVKQKIDACRSELEEAKNVHKNNLKYDAITQSIQAYPGREISQNKLEDARAELMDLQQVGRDLEGKIDMRKKQFKLLMSSIYEMKSFLEDESYGKKPRVSGVSGVGGESDESDSDHREHGPAAAPPADMDTT